MIGDDMKGENIRQLHADLCSHWHIRKNKPACNYLTVYFIGVCGSSELVGFYSTTNGTASESWSSFILTIILSVLHPASECLKSRLAYGVIGHSLGLLTHPSEASSVAPMDEATKPR